MLKNNTTTNGVIYLLLAPILLSVFGLISCSKKVVDDPWAIPSIKIVRPSSNESNPSTFSATSNESATTDFLFWGADDQITQLDAPHTDIVATQIDSRCSSPGHDEFTQTLQLDDAVATPLLSTVPVELFLQTKVGEKINCIYKIQFTNKIGSTRTYNQLTRSFQRSQTEPVFAPTKSPQALTNQNLSAWLDVKALASKSSIDVACGNQKASARVEDGSDTLDMFKSLMQKFNFASSQCVMALTSNDRVRTRKIVTHSVFLQEPPLEVQTSTGYQSVDEIFADMPPLYSAPRIKYRLQTINIKNNSNLTRTILTVDNDPEKRVSLVYVSKNYAGQLIITTTITSQHYYYEYLAANIKALNDSLHKYIVLPPHSSVLIKMMIRFPTCEGQTYYIPDHDKPANYDDPNLNYNSHNLLSVIANLNSGASLQIAEAIETLDGEDYVYPTFNPVAANNLFLPNLRSNLNNNLSSQEAQNQIYCKPVLK